MHAHASLQCIHALCPAFFVLTGPVRMPCLLKPRGRQQSWARRATAHSQVWRTQWGNTGAPHCAQHRRGMRTSLFSRCVSKRVCVGVCTRRSAPYRQCLDPSCVYHVCVCVLRLAVGFQLRVCACSRMPHTTLCVCVPCVAPLPTFPCCQTPCYKHLTWLRSCNTNYCTCKTEHGPA